MSVGKTETMIEYRTFDRFTRAYVGAMLWSSTDGDDEPLDSSYDWTDLSQSALDTIRRDCSHFQGQAGDMIASDIERAGHDFWLTRNGHGSGFWDGDWPEPDATRLDELAKGFGEQDPYVGDDGLIYL